jgi:hypothetical protein
MGMRFPSLARRQNSLKEGRNTIHLQGKRGSLSLRKKKAIDGLSMAFDRRAMLESAERQTPRIADAPAPGPSIFFQPLNHLPISTRITAFGQM